MSVRLALIVILLGSITWSAPARAQCGGTQLCNPGAGDCTIAADCTLTVPAAGLNIDLGTRRLVLTKTLTISGPASAGLFINAGNVLIDGGTIVAPGALDVAGGITIISDTDVTVKNDALIDVSAGVSGGEVDLEATAGNLTFNGRIKANGTTRAGDGGDVNLFAGGLLSFSGGTIDASSGDMAFGGTISLQSLNGSTTVTVPLNASGGDAGEIDVTAGTTLQMSTAADLNVGATGDAGSGGEVDIEAVGDITIGGDSDGAGAPAASSTDQQSGGDGADVSIISDTGNVTMNGHIDSSAAAGGLGGDLDLEAAVDLMFSKQLISTSTGDGSGGGDVFLAAGRTLSITQQVNAGGGTGSGGSIEASAGATLTVSAPLLTDGPQLGGTISLQGCTVNITSSGIVSAQGPGTDPAGTNVVLASSTMTINGILRATLKNLLTYRMAPAPSIGLHAVVQPARDDPARPDASLLPELSRNDDDVDHHLDHRGGNDDQHDRAARHLRRPRRVGHGAVRRRQSRRGRLLLADLPVRALGQPVHERQQCLHRRRLQRHRHLHACGRQRGNDLPRRRGTVRRGRDLHRHVHRLPGRREEHRAVPRRGGRLRRGRALRRHQQRLPARSARAGRHRVPCVRRRLRRRRGLRRHQQELSRGCEAHGRVPACHGLLRRGGEL